MPIVLFKIAATLPKVDFFQFRAPTSIGLAIIPFLTLFSRKKGWYKYAGSWVQPNMPFSYKLQKWMLEKVQRRPVTINGQWPGQPKHVHTFENPCLSEAELPNYQAQGLAREVEMPYTACFVGRLDEAKGVHRIVDLLVSPGIENTIGTFHFVGSGPKLEDFKALLIKSKVSIHFHGYLSRLETFSIYGQSHLVMLPSNSEGFPKIIAEAAAFGCVPAVSDVGSIGQYINENNGFLWRIEMQRFTDFFLAQDCSPESISAKSKAILDLAKDFTFEAYLNKIHNLPFA
jgi:glycosyltransferase involved in cell wall biosynthesis